MKGGQLIATMSLYIALALGLYYCIFIPIWSWSQGDMTDANTITKGILLAIIIVFTSAYFIHKEREKELTKIWLPFKGKVPLKLKHGFSYTVLGFSLVLILGVNTTGLYLPHIIATGLSIAWTLIIILLDADTKRERIESYILGTIAVIGFVLGGFFLKLYSTAISEEIVAFCFAYWMFFELKDKSNRL